MGEAEPLARYRRDGDTWCIDLRLREIRQLFDLRDPAPFRDRDLDPSAAEYIVEAIEEIPSKDPVRIAILVSDEVESGLPDEEIERSIRRHFEHALEVLSMRVRAHLRQGHVALLVGVIVLTTMLLLSENVDPNAATTWRKVLKEGLVIGGWVAIWRPVEHFLYDWWPFVEQRRVLRRILASEIRIKWGRRSHV